jgi:excisionase family DNA binding protein
LQFYRKSGTLFLEKREEIVMPDESLLTLEEVAQRLNVSVATVRRLINDGALKAVRVRFQLRVRPADLDDYVRRHS